MYDRRESFPAGTPANDPFSGQPHRRTGPEHEHERVEDAPGPRGGMFRPDLDAAGYVGRGVRDMDGHRIGTAERILYREGNDAEWVAISMGLLTKTFRAAPLEGASIDEEHDELVLAYPKDMVEAAPEVNGTQLSDEIEGALYAHYNMRRMAQDSDKEPSGLDDPLHPNRP